ncbi:MAG: helix-turn-helix domain-containing protein [Verrucomicrobia bacterium]|nr:helix-turn-helix domain-containing protein [Verrucomicrobiota bacterium]MCH8513865.1 helix-turn-helix domain-containing protein [Kiritimatiellia bacterium]
MDTLGPKLKAAREALNLTQSQVAELTRIKTQQIDGLERDDFSTIPAPMYAKGFIKLYAQVVELDPEPLLELYVMQTQVTQPGKAKLRESARKALAATPPPPPEPEPVPVQTTIPETDQDPDPMPASAPSPAPSRAPASALAESPAKPAAAPPREAPKPEAPRASHLIKRQLPVREPRKPLLKTLNETLRPKIGLLREKFANLPKPPMGNLLRHWPRVAAVVVVVLLLALLPRACSRGPSYMDEEGQLLISNPHLVEPSALRFTLESHAP